MLNPMDSMATSVTAPYPGPITVKELRRRHEHALIRSEQAILCRPDIFRALNTILRHINTHSVDVGVYYRTALDVAELLERLSAGFPDTIFPYFIDSLHPRRQGRAYLFRLHCLDLAGQLEMLACWRRGRRPLVCIK